MATKINDQSLAKAIYGAVVFFDCLKRPLNIDEIHKYLYKKRASQIEIEAELEGNKDLKKLISQRFGYYYLHGKSEVLEEFLKRKKYTKQFWRENFRFIRLLRSVPFIKMIALGGSFSRESVNEISDFDLYIVAQNQRIYLARAFINFLNKKIRASRKIEKDLLQVAFVFSERSMRFLKPKSFLASEMLSLLWLLGPISPVEVLDNNKWVANYFPNGYRREIYQNDYPIINHGPNLVARFFERCFTGKIGDYLERYFRDRTVKKMSSDFEDKYWAHDNSIGLRKDKSYWVEPETLVDKLVAKNF